MRVQKGDTWASTVKNGSAILSSELVVTDEESF